MRENAVSPVLGTILLVAISVCLASVVYTQANTLLDHFSPKDTPNCSIVGTSTSSSILIRHMGGESIPIYRVLINGELNSTGENFTIGETIIIPKSNSSQTITLTDNGNNVLFYGQFSGSSSIEEEEPPEEPPGYSYLLNHSIGIRITLPGDSGSGTKIFCLDAGEGNFMIVRDMEGNVMNSYSLLPIEDWHFTPSNPTTNGVYMWIGTNPGTTLDIESHREEKIPLNYSIITKFALEHTTGENSYRAGLVLHNESPEKLYIMVFRQNVVVFKGENTLVSVPSDTWENNEEISLQVLVRERFTTVRETIISVALDGGWVISDYPISWE